ncbi:MAG: GNAT family N-acetyltransferase [Acidimicrobiia bacterium]|nr:GNAT family N-acetyltransferase [Acidimicrobiia bacterium]
MEIRYQSSLDGIGPEAIHGFFVGWADPPDASTLIRLLEASSHFWLALDGARLVGYIRAISDGCFSAFLPELEILPEYQGLGIGTALLTKILRDLAGFYSIDASCDDELVDYYRRFGFVRGNGMMIRHNQHQAGR